MTPGTLDTWSNGSSPSDSWCNGTNSLHRHMSQDRIMSESGKQSRLSTFSPISSGFQPSSAPASPSMSRLFLNNTLVVPK